MNTENLSTLVIHKLTQDQYNRVVEEGEIDENALYLTPDEITDTPQPDWNQTDETALDFIKNNPVEETEDDALEMLFDMGIIVPAVDDGAILTDENGNILVI